MEGLPGIRVVLVAVLILGGTGSSLATEDAQLGGAETKLAARAAAQVSAESCAMLDDPKIHGRMDGLLGFLARACGRQAEFIGRVESVPMGGGGPREPNTDLNVSDPAGDTGSTRTQSESSIERNPDTGTLCAAYNDSFHGVTQNVGFSGFSRSTDGGNTWEDRGAVSDDDSGDPSLVWRRMDGKFYYAALRNGGLGLYRSDDDCQSFVFVSQIASGDDDKEIMAIDNDPTSPFYGRIYIVWTDFGNGARIFSTFSTDAGASWSPQLAISAANDDVQGAWPTIAPNGDIYVAWIHWLPPNGFPSGDVEVSTVRSTNGGVSYTELTPPMTGQPNPRDATASNAANCNRPAIKGNIRLLPSPQLVFRGGFLHAIYSYDPDGFNTGDVIDVYYRRYDPGTAQWGPEIRINDDGTTTDQYQPTIAVGSAGQVTVGYYSRQLDPNNLLLDYYSRTSFDNGASWTEPSVRLSDESSPVVLDGSLADCYHGDYDQQLQDEDGRAHYLWSDDRDGTPDIFTDRTLVGTDFLVVPGQNYAAVCAPDDAVYPININQFQGFAEPVTLAASGNPTGSTVSFSNNTQVPPYATELTVTTTGVDFGTSTIALTGTADPSGIVQTGSVILDVFTAAPEASTLLLPADMATVVPLRPGFEWQAAIQGAGYVLEVSTTEDFQDPLLYTATVVGTSHVPTVDLPSNTPLYWRVRADNICGVGPDSSVFSFTTVPLPGDCPIGAFAQSVYSTDFEGDNSAWTLGPGSTGTSNWAISTARPLSGTRAFLAQDIASVSDQRLISPAITLPAAQPPLSLIYFSDQTIEDGGAGCFDGGILEISTDGGTSFAPIDASAMLTDPYDGTMDGGFSNPLAGLPAWCGDPQPYTRSVVDLTSFSGQTVRFRFRMGTDSSVGRTPHGWYVDDVSVQSCSDMPPEDLFANGFE